MDATEAARREAERIHQAAVAAGDDPWNLLELVSREAARRDLDVYALPQGDSALKSGRAVFDSQAGSILYEDTGSVFDRAFLIAHELGHVVLEGGIQDAVTEEVEPDRSAEDAPVGIERVLDYGARERREVRMDLFARELLLPRSVARHHHVDGSCSSADIAKRLGAPLQVVQQQLLDALLLPIESTASIQSAMRCPCGCGHVIELLVVAEAKPRWDVSVDAKGRPTLTPSVWLKKGCRSHFWIRRGRVHWC